MAFYQIFVSIILFILSFDKTNNFIVLPFNTIFIKDKTLNEGNYFSNLTQIDLCVNFSIGSNKENIKCILKMDKTGFIIYENAYNYENSTSYENFEKEIFIRWIPSSMRFPSRDKLYLPHYKSYKDFKNSISYENNKTNKSAFLRIDEIKIKNPNYFNEMYYEYGIIGLQLNANPSYAGLEFVKSLKHANETNSLTFHLYFENTKKNGFAYNNNKGYFIVGEELTDNKNKTQEIDYINCLEVKTYSKLIWGMNFSHIYLNFNEKNIKEIEIIEGSSEIIVNYPYIKGVQKYFEYIDNLFFNDLTNSNPA